MHHIWTRCSYLITNILADIFPHGIFWFATCWMPVWVCVPNIFSKELQFWQEEKQRREHNMLAWALSCRGLRLVRREQSVCSCLLKSENLQKNYVCMHIFTLSPASTIVANLCSLGYHGSISTTSIQGFVDKDAVEGWSWLLEYRVLKSDVFTTNGVKLDGDKTQLSSDDQKGSSRGY